MVLALRAIGTEGRHYLLTDDTRRVGCIYHDRGTGEWCVLAEYGPDRTFPRYEDIPLVLREALSPDEPFRTLHEATTALGITGADQCAA